MLSKIKLNALWGKALSDSSHYVVATLFLKLASVLVIPILTRSFSVEEFAIYDLFLSFYAFLFIVLGLGTDSGVAVLIAENRAHRHKLAFLLVASLISVLSVSVAFFVCSLLILAYMKISVFSNEQWLLLCFYLTFSLQAYLVLNFCRFNGRVKSAAYANLVSSLSGIAIGLSSILLLDGDITSYLYGLTIGAFIGLIICIFLVRDVLSSFSIANVEIDKLKELFRLSLPFVPAYVGNSLIQLVDRFIILAILDVKALGIYALASRISAIPTVILSTISKGILPVILNNYASEQGLRFSRQILHSYALSIPLFILFCYLVSEEIIMVFGGDEYLEASNLVPLVVCSVLIFATTNMGGFGFIIKRKTSQIALFTYIALFVNLIASYVLGIYFGLIGVIAGTIFASIIRAYLHISYSERLYFFSYKQLLLLGIFAFSSMLALFLSY